MTLRIRSQHSTMSAASSDGTLTGRRARIGGVLIAGLAALWLPAPAWAQTTPSPVEQVRSEDHSAAAVEALLRRAESGDAAAAVLAGDLFNRGTGGVVWDPPTALHWYAAAAVAGRTDAAAAAQRLWKSLAPLKRTRAEALLAKSRTDEELAALGIGPIDRDRLKKHAWTANVRLAGIAPPAPPAVAQADLVAPPATEAASAAPAPSALPVPGIKPKAKPAKMVANATTAKPAVKANLHIIPAKATPAKKSESKKPVSGKTSPPTAFRKPAPPQQG